jgi:hypothetical protein
VEGRLLCSYLGDQGRVPVICHWKTCGPRDGYGLHTTPRPVSFFTLSATPQQIAAENPDQHCVLLISGSTASSVYIAPANTITSTKGYVLTRQHPQSLKLVWPVDYNLPQVAWFAATASCGRDYYRNRSVHEARSQPIWAFLRYIMTLIANPFQATVQLSSTRILGPSQHRKAILLSCPPTNRITIQFGARRCAGRGLPDPLSGRGTRNP